MVPIISIVGKSKAGKTTLLEQLIGELKQCGYRFAVIKHTQGFDLDKPGKDSQRFAQAGSEVVILSSPHKLALIKQVEHEATLEELSHLAGENLDFILTEGFKRGKALKIEVHRKGLGELLCSPEELFAIVTDEPLEVDIPQFPHSEVKGIADFVERKLSSLPPVPKPFLSFKLNGVRVPASPLVKNILSNVLLGMVSTLKGVGEVKEIEISLSRVEETVLLVNDAPVSLNPFVEDILSQALLGIVSALEGVGEIKSLQISLRR